MPGWDFPSTAKAARVKANKGFLWAVTPSPNKFPWLLPQLGRKCLRFPAWWLVTYGGRPQQSALLRRQKKTRKVYTHWIQAKLSRHEMRQKEKFISWFLFLFFFNWWPTAKLAANSSPGKSQLTNLWGQLKQGAYRTYTYVLSYDSPHYDKWHKRQRQRNDVCPWERIRSITNSKNSTNPKNYLTQIFSPSNLNLGGWGKDKEEFLPSSLNQPPQPDIQEVNMTNEFLTSCQLLAIVPGFHL